ncbi:MAG TPA: hypothetical protein VNS09_07505 [Solirubrobacter sp.]|nr:hypothetical protein [Solirubrobacter sp.]
MTARPAALAAMVLAALMLPLAAGCGGDDGAGDPQATPAAVAPEASQDCASVGDLTGAPTLSPPADLPILDGAHVYESQGPFGKTTQYFAAIAGDAQRLPATRDAVVDQLTGAGYQKLATDQEAGTEAEAHLSGPHTVDVQVINLCSGKLRVRYTVG